MIVLNGRCLINNNHVAFNFFCLLCICEGITFWFCILIKFENNKMKTKLLTFDWEIKKPSWGSDRGNKNYNFILTFVSVATE